MLFRSREDAGIAQSVRPPQRVCGAQPGEARLLARRRAASCDGRRRSRSKYRKHKRRCWYSSVGTPAAAGVRSATGRSPALGAEIIQQFSTFNFQLSIAPSALQTTKCKMENVKLKIMVWAFAHVLNHSRRLGPQARFGAQPGVARLLARR